MRGAPLVCGEVEACTAALVLVENGVGKGDEGVPDGNNVVSAEGAEEDSFAAREGDDGGKGCGRQRRERR